MWLDLFGAPKRFALNHTKRTNERNETLNTRWLARAREAYTHISNCPTDKINAELNMKWIRCANASRDFDCFAGESKCRERLTLSWIVLPFVGGGSGGGSVVFVFVAVTVSRSQCFAFSESVFSSTVDFVRLHLRFSWISVNQKQCRSFHSLLIGKNGENYSFFFFLPHFFFSKKNKTNKNISRLMRNTTKRTGLF